MTKEKLDEINPLSNTGRLTNKVLSKFGNQQASRYDAVANQAKSLYDKWIKDSNEANLQPNLKNLSMWLRKNNVHSDVIQKAFDGIGVSDSKKYLDSIDAKNPQPTTPSEPTPSNPQPNQPSSASSQPVSTPTQKATDDSWAGLMAKQGKQPQDGSRKEFLDYLINNYQISDAVLKNLHAEMGDDLTQPLGKPLYQKLVATFTDALNSGVLKAKGNKEKPQAQDNSSSVDKGVMDVFSQYSEDKLDDIVMAAKSVSDPRKLKELQKIGYAYLKAKGLV